MSSDCTAKWRLDREPEPTRHQDRIAASRRCKFAYIVGNASFSFSDRSSLSSVSNIWNPECLSVNLNLLQSMLGQIFLFQTEKSEVWQVAQDRLKPAMLCQNFAHPRIGKLVHIKSEHGDVLRCAWGSNRIEDRLRKIFAEVNAALFKFQHCGNLIV